MKVEPVTPLGVNEFTIRESQHREHPTVRISPDLPVCDDCLKELFDPDNPRYGYPYINCTNCGPRYTVVLGLPYDRANTTMKDWPLDDYCAAGIRGSGQPAISRPAGGLPGLRAGLLSSAARPDAARHGSGHSARSPTANALAKFWR